MKYIIGKFHKEGLEFPILFPETLNHKSIAKNIFPTGILVSAGFIEYDEYMNHDKLYTYGNSFTLKIESRKEDINIITRYLKG